MKREVEGKEDEEVEDDGKKKVKVVDCYAPHLALQNFKGFFWVLITTPQRPWHAENKYSIVICIRW